MWVGVRVCVAGELRALHLLQSCHPSNPPALSNQAKKKNTWRLVCGHSTTNQSYFLLNKLCSSWVWSSVSIRPSMVHHVLSLSLYHTHCTYTHCVRGLHWTLLVTAALAPLCCKRNVWAWDMQSCVCVCVPTESSGKMELITGFSIIAAEQTIKHVHTQTHKGYSPCVMHSLSITPKVWLHT